MKKENIIKGICLFALGLFIASLFLTGCISSLVTPNAAGVKAQEYMNKYFLIEEREMAGLVAKYTDVTEDGDFYDVTLEITKDKKPQHEYHVYVTKAGNNILLNPETMYIYDINRSPEEALIANEEKAKQDVLKSIPKRETSTVDLFVMSGCPYGLQAEEALLPVVNHLGKDLSNLNLHYIHQPGNNKHCYQGYCAMHGLEEARENARQLCILSEQKDKFWSYIQSFNKSCKVMGVTPQQARACSQKSAKAAGIDFAKVESCLTSRVKPLMAKDLKLSAKYKAFGSPTFIINGHKYEGGRSSNELLTAICAGYKNPPAACATKIKGGDKASSVGSGGCNAAK